MSRSGRAGGRRPFGVSAPAPQVLARRTLALPLNRELELLAIDDAAGHCDVWLRMRNASRHIVGQLHTRPGSLRALAAELELLAGELGVEP